MLHYIEASSVGTPPPSRWVRMVAVVGRFIWATSSYFLFPTRFPSNPDGLDVSLTSHGKRILTAGIAVTSFCAGANHIRHVYFTVDEEERITFSICICLYLLRRKGVRILVGTRRGPHSKYWYFMRQAWDRRSPFILIDDDVIYSGGLSDFLVEHSSACSNNACVRALRFRTDNGVVAPYSGWPFCLEPECGHSVFATNVGGVVIKPEFAFKLLELDEKYKEYCRSADDVWFHWVSVRYRMPYTQLLPAFLNPMPIPGTQGNALSATVNIAGNDQAIAGQYTRDDLLKIERSASELVQNPCRTLIVPCSPPVD